MNYELLKLSKILPTIKGKKTVEIYEESLQRARENQQAQQEENAQSPFYSPKIHEYSNSSAVRKAYKKFSESKSATKLQQHTLEDSMNRYVNLKILLKGEENMDSLMASVRAKSKQGYDQFSASATGFNSTRPNTSSVPPGNFVFRKKKINLRESEEALHIHHYALGTGVNFLSEKPSSLKGRRVKVRETTTDLVVRQQKKYLKDLKQDPATTFNSPNSDGLSIALNNIFNSTTKSQAQSSNDGDLPGTTKLLSYRQKMNANASQDYSTPETPKKMSSVMLDGAYLKSFDSKKALSTLGSPDRMKVSTRGFHF